MVLILRRRLSETFQYSLPILVGFLAGTLVLLDVPLKWTVALIMVVGFVTILLLVRASKRLLLFVLVLLVPVYMGIGLPAFLTRIGQVGLSVAIDLQLIDVIVMALLMYRLVRLATHQAEIRLYPFTTVPALAWLVASALSVANARDVGLAVVQIGHMGKLFLLYMAVASNVEDEGDFNWLMAALAVGVLFEGMLGSYQAITGKTLGLLSSGDNSQMLQMNTDQGMVTRVYGTLGHPNSYAMYLSATVSFALALLFSRIRGLRKALGSVVLCVGVLGIILSLSRGGWLALVAVFLLVPIFAIRRRRQSLRTASAVGFVSLLVLLSLALGQRHLITTRLTSDDHGAAYSRVTMAEGAIAIIQDYPLLGVGLNNYALLMPKYDSVSLAEVGRPMFVHNIFLLIAAETGLVGLAAFVWLLASVFVQAGRLASRAPNDTLWVAGVGVFSAYTALSLHGMVDYAMLSNMPVFRLFWLFAGVVAGLRTNAGHDPVGSRGLGDE
jgi:putative inorganic carbon (HCO3(-)) transporter